MHFYPSFSDEHVEKLAMILQSMQPLEVVTPLNRDSEREKWLSAPNFTNPTFEYDENFLKSLASKKQELFELCAMLSDSWHVESEDERISIRILRDRVHEAELTMGMASGILTHNDAETRTAVLEKYGIRVDDEDGDRYEARSYRDYGCLDKLLTERFSVRALLPPQSEHFHHAAPFDPERAKKLTEFTFDGFGIAKAFSRALDYIGAKGWSVEVKPGNFAINVLCRDRRIVIPEKRTVDGLKLLELIGHEINTHVRTYENACKLFTQILPQELHPLIPILASSDDSFLNEGVAKMSDWRISGDKAIPGLYYVKAIELAVMGYSFAETAEEIYRIKRNRKVKEASAKRTTWDVVYRVYRGITDSENPAGYAFVKDVQYLYGWLEVAWLSDQKVYPEMDKKAIYNFCSLSQKEINWLSKAQLLPENGYLNQIRTEVAAEHLLF